MSESNVEFIFPGRAEGHFLGHGAIYNSMEKMRCLHSLPKITPAQITQAFRRDLFAELGGDAFETARTCGLATSHNLASDQIRRAAPESIDL
jgi:hypothetical protein